MIRSLYSGVSGMKNHQVRMDVIGNNIANVNTTAYKTGRVNFQDTLYQTVLSGGDGRNPAQVGAGMTVASISNNFTQGSQQNTGRTLDLAIDGQGFFMVSDGQNNFYTRDGVFFLDQNGFLVNAEGLRVQSTQGDIRVHNGPVSTINIGPDGSLSGTNWEGNPLQLSSQPLGEREAVPARPAQFIGDTVNAGPMLQEAMLRGTPINVVSTTHNEARVKGNNSGVAPLGINLPPYDMSTHQFTIQYNDGSGPINSGDLNTGLTNITSWQDLAQKLQANIDGGPLQGLVRVSYDPSPYGGLVFETITDPDAIPAITPSITIGGANVNLYMGNVTALTSTGDSVVPMDWTGRSFQIDTGNGWQEVILDASFNAITSGNDLANKLQALLDGMTTPNANVKVRWDNDRLVFETVGTTGRDVPKITLGGPNVSAFIGSATPSVVGINSADWSNKDININFNGTTYEFSQWEKRVAGLDNVINGDALARAMQELIDNKIGKDKVTVTWNGRLRFETKNTPDGITPIIRVGGKDAMDFIGANPQLTQGVAGTPKQILAQEAHIALATFENPEGLLKAGNNLYKTSQSSGGVTVGKANSPGFGSINSSYLEMSNVDLTEEFTNIITTQRGYQANARVITVSDTMLEELINLKR